MTMKIKIDQLHLHSMYIHITLAISMRIMLHCKCVYSLSHS